MIVRVNPVPIRSRIGLLVSSAGMLVLFFTHPAAWSKVPLALVVAMGNGIIATDTVERRTRIFWFVFSVVWIVVAALFLLAATKH